MTDYTISSKLSNETVYACYRGRFWHWNGSIWKESRIMTHRFELARAADKNLTPQAFLTNGAEFAPLDEYEIDCAMLDALENAKPCKNAPIDPVEEDSSSGVPAPCICSTCTCGGCKEECFGNCHNCGHPVQECNSYQTEGEKHLTPAHSADVAEPFGNIPAAPSFDFSPLGELSGQAAEADQQFDLHYGAAQDEYLISCIYLARIHTLTAKAGRYGGGTWTKWYESKGLSHGSVTKMVQNGEAFNSSTVDELKQLPELTRKDLNLIARAGCAQQVVAAAGDSQRVQELLAQIKAEKDRAAAAETREEEARKAAHEYHEKYEEAAAMRATLLDQQGAYIADIDGLKKQNAKLQQSYHDADESRIAANLQRQKAEAERDRAEARAKDAENQLAGSRQVAEAAKRRADKWQAEAESLKKQPITAVVDEEEVDKRAGEKAYKMASDMTAELKAKLEQATADNEQDARNAYDGLLLAGRTITNAWQMAKPLFAKLPEDQRDAAANQLVRTLSNIQGEVARCL